MLGGGCDTVCWILLLMLLKASLLVIMSGKVSVAQTLTFVPKAVADEKCEECPSYCDENGAEHGPVNCRLATALSFCCNFGVRLDCCSNETLMITSDIGDGFHCPAIGTFNRTVLSVCVPVGFVCFVTAVVLIIFQRVRRRRRRTSNNSHFDRRSTSNASSSTRGSRCSIDSHQFPQRRDSASDSNNRQQQQHHHHQQSAVVISPSNLDDSIRINDDVMLRVLQTINSAPSSSSAVGTASSAETCFIIQSNVYPPPYTDERPPPYSDIFPS